MRVPCLKKCQSKTSEKIFTFVLKMPNCAAFGCINHSMENLNLTFHEYVMSGCKIVRGKNPFPITSISIPIILKKTVSN